MANPLRAAAPAAFPRLRRPLLGLGALVWAGAATPAGAITGVCPDGSIFIVQSEAAIPCRGAKRMESHEVPPVRPEYLPRPYTWEVYEEQGDPNNPYNLVDAAREVRALREAGAAQDSAPSRDGEQAQLSGPAPSPSVDPRPEPGFRPRALGLSDEELQNLYQIVELSQQRAPARFVKQTADGRSVLRIALAHSQSFEARLARPEGGPVLLFLAVAQQPARLEDELTFVQRHHAFQPVADQPSQLGVLQGELGQLDAGEAVLGYVALPAEMDVREPMDVYWNDRRLTVTFRP